jgi:hypothetical protein
MAGGGTEEKCFSWYKFCWSNQQNIFYPTLNINWKYKYPPLAKNLAHVQLSHVLYHFTEFDNCLCNFLQSKVSCCLHMYFLWRNHLPPDKSESDQDYDSDWCTYCIDIWLSTLLFSLQHLSEPCSGNDNTFLLPNPWVVLFFIYPTFYSLKNFVYPTIFSSVPPPRHKEWPVPYNFQSDRKNEIFCKWAHKIHAYIRSVFCIVFLKIVGWERILIIYQGWLFKAGLALTLG